MDFELKEKINLLQKILNNPRLRNKLNYILTSNGVSEYFINIIKILNTITPPMRDKIYYINYFQIAPTDSGFDPILFYYSLDDIIDDLNGLTKDYEKHLIEIDPYEENEINEALIMRVLSYTVIRYSTMELHWKTTIKF